MSKTLLVLVGELVQLLAVLADSKQQQVCLCIFFDLWIGGRRVNVVPQEERRFVRLSLCRDLRRHHFHPDQGPWVLAPFQEGFRGIFVILQVHVVDESQVFVKAPVIRICFYTALHEFDSQIRPARAGWRALAEKNCPEVVCRSEEHTSELQSRFDLVCRLLLEKKK